MTLVVWLSIWDVSSELVAAIFQILSEIPDTLVHKSLLKGELRAGRTALLRAYSHQLFSNAVANASSDSERSRFRRIPRSTSARRSAA